MTSSSPVDSTPTRGGRRTVTASRPTLASTPMWAGVSTVPSATTTSPGVTSSPDPADVVALGHRRPADQYTGLAVPTVSSTITMASAPGGTGAPVMIRTA